MSDDTETVFLDYFPLITEDAAALTSDIMPEGPWQPKMVLRTDPTELLDLGASGIAADGDIWRIMLAAPSAMPDTMFYPIAMTASIVGLNTVFWEDAALYAIAPPVGVVPLQHAWRSFTLDSVRTVWNGGVVENIQTAAPVFQGFPPTTVEAIETGISAIGGLQFICQTFDAGQAAAQFLSIDARWLGFPRSLARSAGFYMPRLFYKPN